MPPPVFIWVRATVDWDDDDAYLRQVDPSFLEKLAVWNETFTIPYHAFRAELRRIAQSNHSRVAGATCAEWDEIPDGALVVPVDDDDWFAPDLATVLHANHDADACAYRWASTFLEVPTTLGHHVYLARRAVMPQTPPKYFCTTNNYAVVKHAGARPLAANHVRASQALLGSQDVKQIDARLSLMNRTLASQTTLSSQGITGRPAPGVTRGHLVRKYRRYRQLYERGHRRAPEWSRPYVALMAELMRRLDVRQAGAGS